MRLRVVGVLLVHAGAVADIRNGRKKAAFPNAGCDYGIQRVSPYLPE